MAILGIASIVEEIARPGNKSPSQIRKYQSMISETGYHDRVVRRLLINVLLVSIAGAVAQVSDEPNAKPVAGIPVNHVEANAGTYTLPDPLTMADGKPVRDAKTWLNKRRPELVRLFEENQFGHAPDRPLLDRKKAFEVFEKSAPALNGKALRTQVTIHFSPDPKGPHADLLIYVPAAASGKPVPMLLNTSFTANSNVVDDPGIKPGEVWNREKKRVPAAAGRAFGRVKPEILLDRGIGFATIYYGDIDPDFDGGVPLGVRSLFPPPSPGDWGSISAWAWGLSRALDYLETDKSVDAKRVVLMGISRLGKTVLWAGARDARFAAVIASCSGEGGAALSRRNYGERIKHLAVRYGYQFAANYAKYGDDVDAFPVDSHLLVALIAPRPLLLQTGNTDRWSDPKGEFLAAVAATPVYKLLGKTGIEATAMPEAGRPLLDSTLAYFMHDGGHGTVPSDWEVFVKFLELNLR